MGQGFQAIFLFEACSYFQSIGLPGPACSIGHRNKQGMSSLEVPDHIKKTGPGNPFPGWKEFQRNKRLVLLQQFTDLQEKLLMGATCNEKRGHQDHAGIRDPGWMS
jgi:hypothetical protein